MIISSPCSFSAQQYMGLTVGGQTSTTAGQPLGASALMGLGITIGIGDDDTWMGASTGNGSGEAEVTSKGMDSSSCERDCLHPIKAIAIMPARLKEKISNLIRTFTNFVRFISA